MMKKIQKSMRTCPIPMITLQEDSLIYRFIANVISWTRSSWQVFWSSTGQFNIKAKVQPTNMQINPSLMGQGIEGSYEDALSSSNLFNYMAGGCSF